MGDGRSCSLPHILTSYPLGIAPLKSTNVHSLPKITLPREPSGCTPLSFPPFHSVKVVATACGLFGAAPGSSRHH